MVSNRERVGRTLDATAEALEPFVARTLAAHVPAGLEWPAMLRALDESRGEVRDDTLYTVSDLQCQMRVMTERIGDLGFPFSEALSRAEQNLAGELRDVRNKWAHSGRSTSTTPTGRSTLRSACFARPAQPIAADEVKADRVDLQRAQIESETRKDVRESLAIAGLGDVELTPWREVLKPHPDVLSGRFKESEFAANLYSVAHQTGRRRASTRTRSSSSVARILTDGLKDLSEPGCDPDGRRRGLSGHQPSDDLRWGQDPLDARGLAPAVGRSVGDYPAGDPGNPARGGPD